MAIASVITNPIVITTWHPQGLGSLFAVSWSMSRHDHAQVDSATSVPLASLIANGEMFSAHDRLAIAASAWSMTWAD